MRLRFAACSAACPSCRALVFRRSGWVVRGVTMATSMCVCVFACHVDDDVNAVSVVVCCVWGDMLLEERLEANMVPGVLVQEAHDGVVSPHVAPTFVACGGV